LLFGRPLSLAWYSGRGGQKAILDRATGAVKLWNMIRTFRREGWGWSILVVFAVPMQMGAAFLALWGLCAEELAFGVRYAGMPRSGMPE